MRKLLKLAAYTRAPKATFALLHPIRALKWGAVYYVGRKLYDRARRFAEPRPGEEAPSSR
jgi:hypothetical protein